MPLTSPGNDDDTGENHQPTLRKNTAEPVEQTLKQNSSWGESPIRSDFPEETRVLLDRMEPRERGLLVDDIRHAAVVSGFRAAVMAVVEIVAAGRRPDRAAIDQTARRIAQGDGPESRARLDTYSRFMREDGDE